MLPFSEKHVRAVTHLNISDDDAEKAGKAIQLIFESFTTKA